jgi:DNA-binding SARP family transcriptional activator
MLFEARLAAPRPGFLALSSPAFNRVFESPVTCFTAPEGYLLTDSLAAVLSEHRVPVGWLRLSHEDCDPAVLLLSLIRSLQQSNPQSGNHTLRRMRAQPGPIAGWAPLFDSLAVELSEQWRGGGVLVLEDVDALTSSLSVLNFLGEYFLSRLPETITCVLTAQHKLARFPLPRGTEMRDFNDLRLDKLTANKLMKQSPADLTALSISRAVDLAGGRAAILAGLVDAGNQLGPGIVHRELMRALNLEDLLKRLAQVSLVGIDGDALQGMLLLMQLGYSHPSYEAMISSTQGPWMQTLEGGWERLRGLWTHPLRSALHLKSAPDARIVYQSAGLMVDQKALYQAVNLYFELNDTQNAARIITGIAGTMLDLGQWATLSTWLKRIPQETLTQWPWLVYIGGKIDAAQGHADIARRSFAASSALFNRRQDIHGTCLSLLAESALAAWRGDVIFSKERSLTAFTTAQRANLAWYQCWAAWQLGCLAATANDLDEALAWFGPAAGVADQAEAQSLAAGTLFSGEDTSSLGEMLHLAEKLVLRQKDLARREELYQKAIIETERAEKEVSASLRNLMYSPPENLDALLETHGWTHMPLMPISSALIVDLPGNKLGGVWQTLLNVFSERTRAPTELPLLRPLDLRERADETYSLDATTCTPVSVPEDLPLKENPVASPSLKDPLSLDSPSPLVVPGARPGTSPAENAVPPQPLLFSEPSPESSQEKPEAHIVAPSYLTVRLFGQFSVSVNGQPVVDWSHGKGRAILKYLVTHRGAAIPREVLMEVFWPDASPESARNNLNVAIHNLRSALHANTDHPLVLFRAGAYILDPDLTIWSDVEAFERAVREGLRLEAAGQRDEGMKEFHVAIDLYLGDFLSDDPYESWPLLIREQLRLTYLDTLDRLSQMYLARHEYAVCITLCHKLLDSDNCREDAYCRLMRCYSRLSQDHLALRQYQICVETLRSELDVAPSAATTALYERLRQRERI